MAVTFLAFVLLIGPLVTIHELGHFIVAKLTGVRVLVFSIGFGPKLIGFRRGETEYRLSVLPLGGYVRMYGDDVTADVPEHERHYAFLEKPYWMKVAIAFAGPAANLLLPLVIFFGLNLGEKTVVEPVVGTVIVGEPGEQAGLRAGDRIVAVDGHPITLFDDVVEHIGARPNQPTVITVQRGEQRLDLQATPSSAKNPDPTKKAPVGRLGLMTTRQLPVVAVAAGSAAHAAGLRDGDRVLSVDGAAVADRGSLLAALDAAAPDKNVVVVVERMVPASASPPVDGAEPVAAGPPQKQTLTLTVAGPRVAVAPDTPTAPHTPCLDDACDLAPVAPTPAGTPTETTTETTTTETTAGAPVRDLRFAVLSDEVKGPVQALLGQTRSAVQAAVAAQQQRRGIAAHEATVVAVLPDSPAASKGLRANALRVVAVDGRPLTQAHEVDAALQKDPDGIHVLGLVDDDGLGTTFLLRMQKAVGRGALGKTPGIVLRAEQGDSVLSKRTVSVPEAAVLAVDDTGAAIGMIVGGLRMLVTGEVGLDQLGGPVLIATVAGDAAKAGPRLFLEMMCLFSVNLALLNLMPVPVLDGGHILLFTVEAVRRKKLSPQARIRATQVGLLLVGMLMAVALFNDVASLVG